MLLPRGRCSVSLFFFCCCTRSACFYAPPWVSAPGLSCHVSQCHVSQCWLGILVTHTPRSSLHKPTSRPVPLLIFYLLAWLMARVIRSHVEWLVWGRLLYHGWRSLLCGTAAMMLLAPPHVLSLFDTGRVHLWYSVR